MKVLIYQAKTPGRTTLQASEYVYELMKKDARVSHVRLERSRNTEMARDYDIILPRFLPPLESSFNHDLDTIVKETGAVCVNPPLARLKHHTKHHLLALAGTGVTPETIISADPSQLAAFARDLNGKVCSKPVDGYGGLDIDVFSSYGKSQLELEAIAYGHTAGNNREMVYQKFIPEVSTTGDKRIHVLFYEPISAIQRKSSTDDYICNVTKGGSMEIATITNRDREIVEKIQPFLKENGLAWCGVDVIGDYLTEINVSCPGMIQYADELQNEPRCYEALMQGMYKSFEDRKNKQRAA